MINDWLKYEAHRESIMMILRKVFNTLSDDEFYDSFSDSYFTGFIKFEKNFDPKITNNERGYLFKIVLNDLKKTLRNNPRYSKISFKDNIYEIYSEDDFLTSEIEQENFNVSFQDSINSFSVFFYRLLKSRSIILENNSISDNKLRRLVRITTPLLKRDAWSSKRPLSKKHLIELIKNPNSDNQSSEYFDISVPIGIVKITAWIGCSRF